LALIATAFCAPNCTSYCDKIMTNCLTTNKQYADNATCMAVCEKFPVGLDADMAGNTLGCRVYHAGAASGDANLHCPHAGPSGAGACGTLCEGYCSIIQGACTGANQAYADVGTCMAACGSLNTSGVFSDQSGNSQFCHLYHATAAIGDPALHCQHAAAAGTGACGTRCDNYCQIIQKNCVGASAQFADMGSCMQFCKSNPDGTFKDTTGDTKDCRIYHAFAGVALNDTTTHCPHAGHSGANVCGTWCTVYCGLATTVCTGANKLYADMGACTTACGAFALTGKPGDTMGNTVQCRIYHLGAASADAASATTHCPHANATATSQCVGGATTSTSMTATATETKKSDAIGLFISLVMTLIVALI